MVKPRSNQPSGSNVLSVQNRQDEEFTRLEKKSRKLKVKPLLLFLFSSIFRILCIDDYFISLKVGDMVYVEEGGHLPADIVLLKSSSEDGVAYVETSQLDGYGVIIPHHDVDLEKLVSICTQWNQLEAKGNSADSVGDADLRSTQRKRRNLRSISIGRVYVRWIAQVGRRTNEILFATATTTDSDHI